MSELRELRQLREENGKHSSGWSPTFRSTAISCRRSCKKALKPRQRRALGLWTQAVFALSGRRAVGLLNITRKTLRYRSRRPPQDALRMRLRELAASRVRFGYWW